MCRGGRSEVSTLFETMNLFGQRLDFNSRLRVVVVEVVEDLLQGFVLCEELVTDDSLCVSFLNDLFCDLGLVVCPLVADVEVVF